MITIDNNNPIMKTIIKEENNYNIEPINAIINDNTIIPGINGKKVNRKKSLNKMEEFSSFNDLYLIYDEVRPTISIQDNKDKIIVRGNPNKRNVSLIIENNDNTINFLDNQNIKYTIIYDHQIKIDNNKNYINGEKNENNFKTNETILKKHKLNNKICLIDYSNEKICRDKNYLQVKYTKKISNSYMNYLENVESGDIILITENIKIDTVKMLLNKISKSDLSIVYINELISENNWKKTKSLL